MVRQLGGDMTSSVFAWRQTSPLFMPEEEKGPQSPSAIPGCLYTGLALAPPLILPLWSALCSLHACDPIDLMWRDRAKWEDLIGTV